MTNDKIALRELLEKGSDTTFLREMIAFAAERLMALETETLCGVGPGERSAGRTNQRKLLIATQATMGAPALALGCTPSPVSSGSGTFKSLLSCSAAPQPSTPQFARPSSRSWLGTKTCTVRWRSIQPRSTPQDDQSGRLRRGDRRGRQRLGLPDQRRLARLPALG